MKSWVQTVILLIVFAALVGGITFVAQSINTRPGSPSDNAESAASPGGLGFHLKLIEPSVARDTAAELNAADHQDFWFENPESSAVALGLDAKSCTCANLAVLVLTPEEMHQIGAWPPGPGADRVPDPARKQQARWQPLEENQQLTLPARVAGAIRMTWVAREPGLQRLRARLWTAAPNNPATRAYQVVEVTVNFVPALQVQPRTAEVPGLEPGTQQAVEFDCWSPTRDRFRLEANEEENDPHFVCTLRPLTAEECRKLAANQESDARMPVRSGYHLTVTVREQADHRLMDVGPFRRRILLTGDPGLEATAEVTGLVRGDLRIGVPDDRDRMNLGKFRADDGTRKTIPLETSKPGLALKVESKFPSYLDVGLTDGQALPEGGTRWELRVTVPPNIPSGRLPRESAIVLKTTEPSPRRIRIPVLGAAYR